MTKNIEVETPDHQAGLLACCRHLAMLTGQEGFASGLAALTERPGPLGRKETLESVMRAGRAAGLSTAIIRLQPDQFAALAEQLPVVAELRDGRYLIVSEIGGLEKREDTVTLLAPRSDGQVQQETTSRQAFLQLAAGGMLRFAGINTALVCFSLIAREHKIELTRDRLLHEYNLGDEEIPKNTLLRMAKELGLKARLLTLSWNNLLNLKKAYPAIAVLRNGRHLVLAGIAEREESGRKETVVACYDPLAGSGGGHLRLTRQEFEAIWAGKVYVLKRPYKLTDESQPFSLRWFIPEILRQKLTFIDIALAVLFINAFL